MTSEDEKTVHQQSIAEVDRALDYVAVTTCDSGFQPERWSSDNDEDHLRVLAAEVRRLREEVKCANALVVAKDNSYVSLQIEHEKAMFAAQFNGKQAAEHRDTIRVMSTNEGKLHAKIAELETKLEAGGSLLREAHAKLARVEALPAKWREGKRRVTGEPDAVMHWADELEAALKD